MLTQKAMSARPEAPPAADFVNRLLGANFAAMERMGDPVLKPFLQVCGVNLYPVPFPAPRAQAIPPGKRP